MEEGVYQNGDQFKYVHADGSSDVGAVYEKGGVKVWIGQSGIPQLMGPDGLIIRQAAPAQPAPAAAAPPAAKVSSPGMFEGVTDAVMRGYTMGLRDPVAAAGGATGKMLADLTQGRDVGNFGDYYSQQKEAIADKDAAFKRDNPVIGYGTEIAASLLNPVAKAAGGYVARGSSMPVRSVKAAATAAPLGATYAAGTARPDDVGKAAAIGGGAGLLIGGLSVPVIETAIGVGRGVLQKVIDSWGGSVTSATKKVTDIIMDMGGGSLERGLQTVKQHLQAGGPETTLVDVLGERGRALARGAVNAHPEARQIGDDWVNVRKATRAGRMHQAADEIAPGNFHQTLDDVNTAQRQMAKPLYDEAFTPVSKPTMPGEVHSNMGRKGHLVQWDQRMDDLFADPLIKQGMAKGIRIQQIEALADDVPFNFQEYAVKGFDDAGDLIIDGVPNLRAMDAAKRGLDEMLEGYRDGVTGKLNLDSYGRAIERLRKSLVAKLDDITTIDGRSAYKEARAAWAGPASLKDAAWMGRRFMRGDEEVVDKVFKSLSGPEQDMFLLGVRREMTKMINTDTQSALTKFDPKKLDFYIRLRNMVPEEQFQKFHAGVREELAKGKVEHFVNPKANSATGGIKEDVDALNRAPNWMIQAFDYIAAARPSAAIAATIKAPINWLNNPSPTTARNLAEMLFEGRPSLQAQVLDDIGTRRLAQDLMPQLSKKYATRLAALLASRSAAPASQVEGSYYGP
tara:strand:- start:1292 stop:3499 length:2208 start_codon:yes stop_codon:yes gene_type:complete